MSERDLAYHRERAREELDCAYRAQSNVVAEAHMRLAGLHMERLKKGDERCCGSGIGRE